VNAYNNIKILIVGCGQIARVHARILKKITNSQNIYCFDNDKDAQSKFIKEFKLQPFDKNIFYDGLIVSTPTNKHLSTFKKFFKYANFFFIEKPLVSSLSELEEFELSADKNKIYCGFIELHNDIFKELQKLIGNQDIASIQILRHSPRLKADRITSNAHLDLAIHDISILLKYFIKFKDISVIKIINNYKYAKYFETSVSRITNKKIRTWRVLTNKNTYELDLLNNIINIFASHSEPTEDSLGFSQKITNKQMFFKLNEPAENQMIYFLNSINKNKIDKEMQNIIFNSHRLLLEN
jgi:predicted dehydrogenase